MAPSRRRLLLGLASALALPVAIACNGIVGIADYERGECSGGGSCRDGGGIDVLTDAPIDARPDVIGVDAAGTAPVSWAKFVMPNYAQAGDAAPNENLQTYAATNGGLLDNVSKLVWHEPITQTGLKSYDDAQKICAAITTGGTWRLPSRIELVTLLDLSQSGKTIDPAFTSTEPSQYWTTSEVRTVSNNKVSTTGKHWTVDFGSGGLGQQPVAGGTAGVRCIKAQ